MQKERWKEEKRVRVKNENKEIMKETKRKE